MGGGGGTELGSQICADQSDGGAQTGPRQGGGSDGWAGLGLVEMRSDTADRPTTGCGTQLGLEEGGGQLESEMHPAWARDLVTLETVVIADV